jgi:hypothetical protein
MPQATHGRDEGRWLRRYGVAHREPPSECPNCLDMDKPRSRANRLALPGSIAVLTSGGAYHLRRVETSQMNDNRPCAQGSRR